MKPLTAAALMLMTTTTLAGAAEFKDFKDMTGHYKEGVDYKVESHDTGTRALVIAIHGGMIEPGTTPLSRKVAGDDHSWYSFEGIMPQGNWELHLGSSKFNDPVLLALTAKSEVCVSIHGCQGDTEFVCTGGGHDALRLVVSRNLRALGIEIREFCENMDGLDGRNPVNRTKFMGVQLEFSRALRDHMRDDPSFETKIAQAVRAAL